VRIEIVNKTKSSIPRQQLLKLCHLIEKEERPPDSSINIIFIGDQRMKRLNQDYRGISKSTDVLSFNMDNGLRDGDVFGEIYISTEMAARYAKSDKMGRNEMVLKLCCHGYLHLLGYDHKRAKDRKAMEEKEEFYLKKALRQ